MIRGLLSSGVISLALGAASIVLSEMAIASQFPEGVIANPDIEGSENHNQKANDLSGSSHLIENAPHLSHFLRPETRAELLLQPADFQVSQLPIQLFAQAPVEDEESEEGEEEVVVEGQRQVKPDATPVYVLPAEEIQKQGANSAAEALRGLPGFAINDVGFGADIHTGTYYRGASINQSVFLLNGRPIGSNISTYHGNTDLNSIPVGFVDRIELSSGGSATLYGSEAFGGVVNIVTKQGAGPFKFSGTTQFGSYDRSDLRGGISGSAGPVRYALGYERFYSDSDYRVPVGAANRGPDGRLFNGDTLRDNYFGNLAVDLNSRNSLSLDVFKITSRRGLLYFGFPLQRDRLDHDGVNVGLSWNAQLGGGNDSTLKTTVSFNQDYFSTYGPTQGTFYRTGVLDAKAITARVDHNWQMAENLNLRWGVDLQNTVLDGKIDSTIPSLISLNGRQERDRFHAALFALNVWQITPTFQTEVGLRQNFNTQFGSYLNPSLGARWTMTPAVALRGSWVSVHRNPGLDQLYFFDTVHNWLPNPDLEPETGSSWTAGVDVRFSPSLTGQFTYFGSRLRDRISVQSGRWVNVGLVDTNGFEAALRWKLSPQWSTFLNYTYTDAEIKTGAERGLQLGLIPFSVGQFGVGYDWNGWQINLYANYYSGARRAIFTLPTDKPTDFSPSWISFDLNARIPITAELGLLIYLENLADKTYEKANRIYQPGLTFRIGLQSTL